MELGGGKIADSFDHGDTPYNQRMVSMQLESPNRIKNIRISEDRINMNYNDEAYQLPRELKTHQEEKPRAVIPASINAEAQNEDIKTGTANTNMDSN